MSDSTRDCKPEAVEIMIKLAILICMMTLHKVLENIKLILVTPTSINWTLCCNSELLTVTKNVCLYYPPHIIWFWSIYWLVGTWDRKYIRKLLNMWMNLLYYIVLCIKPNNGRKVRDMAIPDIASLRLDSDAARYHWNEHLEISEALLSEEACIFRHEPRVCAPSRT